MDEKVWIMIRWLHQKAADLDLHFFTKNGIEIQKYLGHSVLSR